jgi:hypothetical protein
VPKCCNVITFGMEHFRSLQLGNWLVNAHWTTYIQMHVIKCGVIGNNPHEHMGTWKTWWKCHWKPCGATYWEDQNPKDNFKTFHSPSPHTHKLDPPMLSHLSGYMKCLFLKWFVTLFGLGFRYPFLGKWVFIWTCINNNNLKPWLLDAIFFYKAQKWYCLGLINNSNNNWCLPIVTRW